MAVLSDVERARVVAEIQKRIKSSYGGLTKPDLVAAVAATDSWIDTNAAAFNAALPANVRAALSAQDKTALFVMVSLDRAGLL